MKWAERIKGLQLLRMEDVYTTGTTVNECAKVLKKAGAIAVHALTLARMGGRVESAPSFPGIEVS